MDLGGKSRIDWHRVKKVSALLGHEPGDTLFRRLLVHIFCAGRGRPTSASRLGWHLKLLKDIFRYALVIRVLIIVTTSIPVTHYAGYLSLCGRSGSGRSRQLLL